MRPQKVEDLQVLKGFISVFRAKGYEGASLNELAAASGLKKASLYHRFPGGKKEMALAVLNYIEEWIEKNIYGVLVDSTKLEKERIEMVVKNINDLYSGGVESCMFRSLSLDLGIALFDKEIKRGTELWIKGFLIFGMEIGMPKYSAAELASQSYIDIQGSLVLSKSIGTTVPFLKALKKIEKAYS
ncbi:TetR/AcrR family transcriptional regulator [Tenacibaculum maritimum]|uniref:TetR/AcrR family transcriptional regulator n=1 Tax=Tenacibaculum maritimum TaxID=107401 RepID=UPI003875EF73